MGTWSDMFVRELIERIARAEAQVKALQSRLEKVKKPTLYTGAFYATVQLPEKCPDCDARYWISCGPKSMICGVCAAMQAADEAEEQVAALDWTPISESNLPTVGDEVLDAFRCVHSVLFAEEKKWTSADQWLINGWRYRRPINPLQPGVSTGAKEVGNV